LDNTEGQEGIKNLFGFSGKGYGSRLGDRLMSKSDVKTISINTTWSFTIAIIYGCLFILYITLVGFFIFDSLWSLSALDGPAAAGRSASGLIFAVVFALAAWWALTETISCLRLSGLKIQMREDGLFLRKGSREYYIPNQGCRVTYCMMGWLMIWGTDDRLRLLLLRRLALGRDNHVRLRAYFMGNMQYINSGPEKKEFLKSLHINVFTPLRYVRLPESV
jgi:hypothetical protein